MSYRLDLDEIPTSRLREELRQRRRLRRSGKCDYCGREPSAPPCKFPERHQLVEEKRPLLLRLMLFLRDTNQKPGVMTEGELESVILAFRKR